MPGLDGAYIAQFGEHNGWNALHDANEWQPLTSDQVEASETVQRSHFAAFFGAAHGTRFALSPRHSIRRTLRIVRECLTQWRTNAIWLCVRRGLRSRVVLRRHVRTLATAVTQHRAQTLEGWLAYWQSAEVKAQDELQGRQRGRLGAGITAERASQLALAQVMVSTCEEVKVQVLWELYWLLHAQTAIKKQRFWVRWRALLRQRHSLRFRSCSPHVVQAYLKPPMDFWDNEPLSLRAINATLFVMALQAPRFQFRAGEEVTLKELVRLANAPQLVFATDGDARLRHASGVVTAFMESPLCAEAAWLRKRFAMPVPLIPPRTWRADGRSSRRSSRRSSGSSSGSDVLSDDSEELQLLQLLEERAGGAPLRRAEAPRARNGPPAPTPGHGSTLQRTGSTLSRQSSFNRRTSGVTLNRMGSSRQRTFPDIPPGSPQIPMCRPSTSDARPLSSAVLRRSHSKSQLTAPRITTAAPLVTPSPRDAGLRRQMSGFLSHRASPQGVEAPATPKMVSLPPLRN